MNRLALALALAVVSTAALAQDAPVTHRFACADYSQGKVFLVDESGAVEWEYEAPACDEFWVLPDGNLLFTTGHGVKEVDREKNVVFEYLSASEIFACQRLANGNTFIGECSAGRLLEVTPEGDTVNEIRLLPEGTDGGHLYMRNARRLSNGNTLVAHIGGQVVREYDPDGRSVWEVAAPGGPHSAIRLPDGNTLISCGDAAGDSAKVFEVDPDGNTVWQVTSADLPEIADKFIAGVQRLPNGNTVLCHWLGHGHLGEAPHLIEVTPEKQVVWTFADHATMRTVSSVQFLDVPGDAIEGTVLR